MNLKYWFFTNLSPDDVLELELELLIIKLPSASENPLNHSMKSLEYVIFDNSVLLSPIIIDSKSKIS